MSKPSFDTKLLLDQVIEYFKTDDELQKELSDAFSQTPQPQRERIEQEEKNLSGIADGEDLDEGTLSRVKARMTTENSSYPDFKLDFKGGSIVPDKQSYLRAVQDNSAIRAFERKVRRSGRYI